MPSVLGTSTKLHKFRRGTPISYNSKLVVPGDIKILHFNGTDIYVRYHADGFWRDDSGCIFGFVDEQGITDKAIRCGVGIFSLPSNHPLSDACAPHDYAYSCPAYQASHGRDEPDEKLKKDIKTIGSGHWYSILAYPFYVLSRTVGNLFWENSKTNK